MFNLSLMNMVQVLDTVNPDSPCHGFDFIVRIIKNGLFPILQIGIPIILIVLGTLDLGKAVISSDDKENKKIIKRIVRRCVYAILIFFLITIINLIFTIVSNITENEDLIKWSQCWNYYSET